MTPPARTRCPAPLAWITLALLFAACGDEVEGFALAEPDRAAFEQQVLPVLLRDCGFHACHGSRERFFQVFGPGRGRLVPDFTRPLDPSTPDELERNYRRASSMIDPRKPADSPLLRKPLSLGLGGSGHAGLDSFGRDVYESLTDPGYMVLQQWVMSVPPPMPAAPAPTP